MSVTDVTGKTSRPIPSAGSRPILRDRLAKAVYVRNAIGKTFECDLHKSVVFRV
jgi:hypothetical protein